MGNTLKYFPEYESKPSDDEYPVFDFWEMRSTPQLLSIPGIH